MKITKVEIIPVTIPSSGPHTYTSRGGWRSIYTYVRLTTDEGLTGIGEGGHAMPIHYGETQETVMDLLHKLIGPALLGENPFDIDRLINEMDHLICWNWIAKTGVDYALYDIVGKALNVPVYQLLGGRSREKAALGYLMGALPDLNNTKQVDEHLKRAVNAVKAGFHNLKIKVGLGTPDEDVERVRLIREAVGPNIPIHVDANQAWTPNVAIYTIQKIQKYDLYGVESPIPDWDLLGLAKVRRTVGIPIIADEVARSCEGAMNVIRADAADMFVLHLSKAGGLYKSQKYVSIAEAAGMPIILGLMGNTGVEHAASAHLAVAMEWLGRVPHHCIGPLLVFGGFDTKHIIEESKDVVKGGYAKIEKGFLYPPEGVGLGVELDDDKVSQWLTPGKQILVCE